MTTIAFPSDQQDEAFHRAIEQAWCWMLYPDNEEKRLLIFSLLTIKRHGAATVPAVYLPAVTYASDYVIGGKDDDRQTRQERGLLSGYVLYRFVGTRRAGLRPESITDIKDKFKKEIRGIENSAGANSEKKAWKAFACVSHIWAAVLELSADQDNSFDPYSILSSQTLGFISRSELYRNLAENMVPPQSSKPVFPAEYAIRLCLVPPTPKGSLRLLPG